MPIEIEPPYIAGLVALRHRLAAQLLTTNAARIQRIHAASLRNGSALVVQAGPDKQETTRSEHRVASTNRDLTGSHGGRSHECAR